MRKEDFFILIVLGSTIGGVYYLSGYMGVIKLLASILIYFIVFYLINSLWRKIRINFPLEFKKALYYFLYKISQIIFVLGVIIGAFIYYNNSLSPAPMPKYTLTNGDKTVVFQSMSHIGSEEFYSKVKNDIKDHKSDGYVYFYEGVKGGSKKNNADFDKALGVEFSPDLYKNFSKLYGVVHQDNRLFLGLINNLDFNVDMSIDEIMGIYNSKNIVESSDSNTKIKSPINANELVIETLTSLNERQLSVLRHINKSILNFIIRSKKTQGFLTNNFSNKELFEVILDGRNKVLVNEIKNTNYKKIYVTYGLLHFDGVFEMLQESDPKWEIRNTKELYPIK